MEFPHVSGIFIPPWNYYGCIVDELAALQERETFDVFPESWICDLRNVRMTLNVEPAAAFVNRDMLFTLRALDETMEDFQVPNVEFDVLRSSDQVRLARGTIGYSKKARAISQETSTLQGYSTLTS